MLVDMLARCMITRLPSSARFCRDNVGVDETVADGDVGTDDVATKLDIGMDEVLVTI